MTGATAPGGPTGRLGGRLSAVRDASVVAGVDVPALYETHWRAMVRLAVLLVDDLASAEDVVQDAFVGLHRRSGTLRDPDAAVGYLRTSVVNLSRSVIRRRMVARRHLVTVEPDPVPGADQDLLQLEAHDDALRAVRSLPRRQQEVLILRYWSNLSENEIAATLGISNGAVKSTASRGIASLRRAMTDGGRP